MNGDQTGATDREKNDDNRDEHVKTDVNQMNEDFTGEILLSTLVVDAQEGVEKILNKTSEQGEQTEVDIVLSGTPALTLRRPFDFDPAIDRNEGEDPGEAEIEFIIESRRKAVRGDCH